MLERHSGDTDHPRILGAFNEPTPDWLSFFFFTYFTDRDGKYQLASLRESALRPAVADVRLHAQGGGPPHVRRRHPASAACVQRTVELMKEHDTADVRPFGGIDVATLQRYLNFHYSVSLDLFGAETSTNAANYFAAGLKGRFQEERRDDDHRLQRRRPRRCRPWPTARIGDRGRRRRSPRSTRRCATTTSPTARRASTAGTARSPTSASSCACRTSASTAPSARSATTTSARTGACSTSRRGRRTSTGWLPTDDDRRHVESLMQRRHRAGEDGRLDRRTGHRHPRQAGRLRLRASLSRRPSVPGHTMTTYNAAAWLVDRHVAAGRGDRAGRIRVDGRSTDYADAAARGLPGPARPARRSTCAAASGSRWCSTTSSPSRPGSSARCGPASCRCRCRRCSPRATWRRSSADAGAGVAVLSRPTTPATSPPSPQADAELRHAVVLGDAGPATTPGAGPRLVRRSPTPTRRRWRATGADSPAFWLYSSGTTGLPEGRDAPPRQPAGDRRDVRRDGARHRRPTTGACPSPSCSSPTGSATR